MPAGQIIGRVSVKVLPDTDDFRRTAKKDLDVIEKQLEVAVKVVLDSTSLNETKKKIDQWKRGVNPVEIDVKLQLGEASERIAQGRLAVIARDRTVTLLPVVNEGAAAKAATTIAALSGARVISSYFNDIAESIGRLDKNTPIIGTLALATAGLAGWGLSAAANLFSLSSSLAQIGPLALALPGVFGGLAIGLGATVAAFKDFNKVLPGVKKQFSDLQDVISKNFWDKAKAPIKDLIDSLLPQFSSGIAKVSTSLGGFFGGLASALKGSLNGELKSMFDALGKSIDIFKAATPAIANIVKVLGEVGASLLPQLAQWVADIATKFSNFLGEAAKDGRLQGWINDAIEALKQLGNVMGGIGSIFAGLARAAAAAGGSSLGSLATTLHNIGDAINTPAFQTGLTTVLEAAFTAMDNIATKAGPAVSQLFQSLGQMLTSILPLVGSTIGSLVGAIADALSQPAVQSGIQALFFGLSEGVKGLLPAIGPLGAALGALGGVVGALAAALGPTLAVFFTELSKAAVTLAPVVERLIPTLGSGLAGALRILGPLLTGIAGFLLKLLGPIASNSTAVTVLATAIIGLAGAKKGIDVVSKGFKSISDTASNLKTGVQTIGRFKDGFLNADAAASTFSGTAGTLGGKLKTAFSALGSGASAIGSFVAATAKGAAQFVVNTAKIIASMAVTVATTVGGWIAMAAAAVVNAVIMAAQWLVAFAPIILIGLAIAALVVLVIKNWDTIKNATITAWNAIASAASAVWDAIKATISAVVDAIVFIFENFTLPGIIAKHWDTIKAAAQAVWDFLKSLVSTAASFIVTVFTKWTLPGIIATHWNTIKSVATTVWNSITSFISGIPGKIVGFFSKGWTLVSTVTTAFANVYKAATTKFADVLDYVGKIPGKIIAGLGDLGKMLYDAGKQIIAGLAKGIWDATVGPLAGVLKSVGGFITSHKGPPSKDKVMLVNAGQLIIDGLIDGMESRYDAVKASLKGLSDDIAGTTVQPPDIEGLNASKAASRAVDEGLNDGSLTPGSKTLIYNAAPNNSLPEEDLFAAGDRARLDF